MAMHPRPDNMVRVAGIKDQLVVKFGELSIFRHRVRKIYSYFILQPYISIISMISTGGLCEPEDDTPKVIVSLTSYGNRLNNVHIALESILRQKAQPNNIILWVADDDFMRITWRVKKQCRRGVEVRRCPDIGPHKKYFYVMQENPSALVVTADDDLIYRRSWLGELLDSYKRAPSAVHCHRAKAITMKAGKLAPYDTWSQALAYWNGDSRCIFPTSGGGVLFPPGALDERAFDLEALMRCCPRADDVWVKAMLLLKSTEIRLVNRPHRKLLMINTGSNDVALAKYNIEKSGNDNQILAVCREYDISSRLC